MHIQYNTSTMRLNDMPLDIGYASERVSVKDISGKEQTLGGQNGKTQLIITLPFINDTCEDELRDIAKDLPKGGDHEVVPSIIVAHSQHKTPDIKGFDFYIDEDEEFADYYGVKLEGDPCNGELTKALILISKDGAIFYDEFVKDINDSFNTATLGRKILAAQECYTGKGCH